MRREKVFFLESGVEFGEKRKILREKSSRLLSYVNSIIQTFRYGLLFSKQYG